MSYRTWERNVTITQRRYNQLQEQSKELKDAQAMTKYYEDLLRAREETIRSLGTQADIATTRIDALSSELQEVMGKNKDIEKVVIEQNKTLHAMNARHKERVKQIESEFQGKIEEVRAEGGRAIAKAYRDFSDAMEENNRAIERSIEKTAENILERVDTVAADLRREMGEISQQVERMGQGNDELAQMARDLYAAAQAALKDVENGCSHHRILCADQLVAVRNGLADAKMNLDIMEGNKMNAGAAQASARSAFTEAMTLRARAYAMESIWQEHYQLAMSSLVTAESRVRAAKSVAVYKEPETGEVIHIDADVWTEGGLSEVGSTVEGLAERLRSDGREGAVPLSVEDVDGVREALDRASVEADEVANDAYIAFVLSQKRADDIEDFAEMAEELNLGVEEGGYYENDHRKSLRVLFANAVTGLKVALTVEPGGRAGAPGKRFIVDVTERGSASDEGISELLGQIDEFLSAREGDGAGAVSVEPTDASTQACYRRADIDAWKTGRVEEFAETDGRAGDGWVPGEVSARAMGQ